MHSVAFNERFKILGVFIYDLPRNTGNMETNVGFVTKEIWANLFKKFTPNANKENGLHILGNLSGNICFHHTISITERYTWASPTGVPN